MDNSIYTVTVFEKIPSKEDFSIGDSRCWGFFYNRDDATNALIENTTDMFETSYWYGVIEEYTPGICVIGKNADYFMYNKNTHKYEHIDELECFRHICNFAIG